MNSSWVIESLKIYKKIFPALRAGKVLLVIPQFGFESLQERFRDGIVAVALCNAMISNTFKSLLRVDHPTPW